MFQTTRSLTMCQLQSGRTVSPHDRRLSGETLSARETCTPKTSTAALHMAQVQIHSYSAHSMPESATSLPHNIPLSRICLPQGQPSLHGEHHTSLREVTRRRQQSNEAFQGDAIRDNRCRVVDLAVVLTRTASDPLVFGSTSAPLSPAGLVNDPSLESCARSSTNCGLIINLNLSTAFPASNPETSRAACLAPRTARLSRAWCVPCLQSTLSPWLEGPRPRSRPRAAWSTCAHAP